MAKLSPRLSRLIQVGNDDERVNLSLLLRQGASAAQLATLKQQLQTLVGGQVDHVPISGTMHCQAPLKAAKSMGNLDPVLTIDLESTAAVEELIDD